MYGESCTRASVIKVLRTRVDLRHIEAFDRVHPSPLCVLGRAAWSDLHWRKVATMITAASPPAGQAHPAQPAPVLTPLGAGGAQPLPGERTPPRIQEPQKPRINFDPEVVQKNIKEAVEHLNKQMASSGRTLGFSMDEALSMPIVTVKNSHTGEVIRQIPSEAVVRVAHTLESLKGLLHDSTN